MYHDISKYQVPAHLVTSRPTYDIMISVLVFRYYHDILILSWYSISKYQAFLHLVTSKPKFEIMKSISIFWYYHDILILTLVTSRPTYFDIIIMIFSYYHDISNYYSTNCNTVQIWSWFSQYLSSVGNRYPAIYVILYAATS